MSIFIEIPDHIMETVKLPPDRAKRELTWGRWPTLLTSMEMYREAFKLGCTLDHPIYDI
jgi:hypothetical protein